MGKDYQNFMRVLTTSEPGEPTLFEPFIHRRTAEQLIWRRGEHLWDCPERYIDTLLSVYERTEADVVTADARLFPDALEELSRAMVKQASDTLRFVCLCGDNASAKMADRCGAVCAVGVYGEAKSKKPMIRMDGCLCDALRQGCSGWFAPKNAEAYWAESGEYITILGGLGADYVASTGPASIHRRCEALFRQTENRRYALGSGGCLKDGHYLELISMLGIYKKHRF